MTVVLPVLVGIIPDARWRLLDGLDHNAPDLNAPDTVAAEVAAFVRGAADGVADR